MFVNISLSLKNLKLNAITTKLITSTMLKVQQIRLAINMMINSVSTVILYFVSFSCIKKLSAKENIPAPVIVHARFVVKLRTKKTIAKFEITILASFKFGLSLLLDSHQYIIAVAKQENA